MTFALLVELARSDWSLADDIALEQLPEETQQLVARLLRSKDMKHAAGPLTSAEEIYEEGWSAAMRHMEMERSRYPYSNPYAKGGSKNR